MFCQKCGKKLNEGLKFCPKCGSKIDAGAGNNKQEDNSQQGVSNQPKAPVYRPVHEEPEMPKGGSVWIIVAIVLLVIVLLVSIGIGAYFVLNGKSDSGSKSKKGHKTETTAVEDEEDEEEEYGEEEVTADAGTTDDVTPEIAVEITPEPYEPTVEITPEPTPEPLSEYMLPNSDTQYCTERDLYGFTEWECKVARNELYARHGRIFKDEELQNYFNSTSWYYGYIQPDDFKESMLNDYEVYNRDLIVEYEKKMGYRK